MADPRQPRNWQDLAAFAGNPYVMPPMPPTLAAEAQPPRINWQDLRQFAPNYGAPAPTMPAIGSMRVGPDPGSALTDPMRGTAAMPQSMDQTSEFADPGGIASLYFGGVPMAAGGPAFRAGEAGALALARLAGRYPAVTVPAAGAAALTAAPGQAEPPDALSVARDTIGRLRGSQAALEAERTRLEGERRKFDKIDSSNKAAVQNAQRLLGIKPDGSWGEQTAQAIAAHRTAVTRQIKDLDARAERIDADLDAQQTRLTGLEGGERLRASEEDVGPVRRAVRDWGPWAAFGLGGVAGHYTRSRAAHRVAEASAGRARTLDAMLPQPGTRAPRSDVRASAVNEFYRAGGAGENVPYRTVQTGRGFARRPGAVEPSTLFPPGPQLRGGDYGVAGIGGAEAAMSGGLSYYAHQELTEAQAAAQRDPSAINIDRLQKARDVVALTESLWRGGAGVAAGRLGGAYTHPYREARPNVAGAESEVMRLNQLLARDAKKPKPARRK